MEVVATPVESVERADVVSAGLGTHSWFVISGARLYVALLPYVDAVDLTRVCANVEGDARVPIGWLDGFVIISREPGHDQESSLSYTFHQLARRT
ncbi:hypothetical protein FRAHR75_330030 [Frankia sp. Hr75.2]|nr:hypothetical protein FRAHR75_330030 [Frankia sp. Hr75.2]